MTFSRTCDKAHGDAGNMVGRDDGDMEGDTTGQDKWLWRMRVVLFVQFPTETCESLLQVGNDNVGQDESWEFLPLKIKAALMVFTKTSCHLICNSLCRASHPLLRKIISNWSRARDD